MAYNHVDLGAAYGTAKAGIGISTMGVLKPDLIVKSVVPVVMAGILGIYGLIIAVILIQKVRPLIQRLHMTIKLRLIQCFMAGNTLLPDFLLESAQSARVWQ